MGECSDCWMSEEEKTIERIVERRFRAQQCGPSTDALDRAAKDRIRQEVEDEFFLNNGRPVKKGIF